MTNIAIAIMFSAHIILLICVLTVLCIMLIRQKRSFLSSGDQHLAINHHFEIMQREISDVSKTVDVRAASISESARAMAITSDEIRTAIRTLCDNYSVDHDRAIKEFKILAASVTDVVQKQSDSTLQAIRLLFTEQREANSLQARTLSDFVKGSTTSVESISIVTEQRSQELLKKLVEQLHNIANEVSLSHANAEKNRVDTLVKSLRSMEEQMAIVASTVKVHALRGSMEESVNL